VSARSVKKTSIYIERDVDIAPSRRAAAALRAGLAPRDLSRGWWREAPATAVAVAAHYRELGLRLADASHVALAERHDTIDIATLDERRFRAVRPLRAGRAFRLLPADA